MMNEYKAYGDYAEAMNNYDGDLRYIVDSEWYSSGRYTPSEMQKVKRFDATVAQLQDRYPLQGDARLVIGDYDAVQHNLTEIQRSRIDGSAAVQQWIVSDKNLCVIGFDPKQATTSFAEDLLIRQQAINKAETLSTVFFNSPEGFAIHEYGHSMSEYISAAMIYDDEDALDYWAWYKSLDKDEIRKGLSEYAATNRWEFEAEAFAELQTNNPRPLARKYAKYLDKLTQKSYGGDGSVVDLAEHLAKRLDTSSLKTVILPKQEYAHVMSEIATNLTAEEQAQSVVAKAIGDYLYVFENHGFGDYRIIKKVSLDEEQGSLIETLWGER